MNKRKILIADDSRTIQTFLKSYLEQWGFDTITAGNGNEAWSILKGENPPQLVILDWNMPGMDGDELCKRLKSGDVGYYTYILLLTARTNIADKITGLSSGADDYMTKPFNIDELHHRLKVGERILDYEDSLKEKEFKVRLDCYRALTELAETRDQETGDHLFRISHSTYLIAQALGLDESFCQKMKIFSPMHDIGKVGIPDGILHAPRRLSLIEFSIIKTHPTLGYQILNDKQSLAMAAEIAYTHHEKWDGSGYPRGLKEGQIPISGQITGIADVYDALRSIRVYKPSQTHEEVVEEIKKLSGSHFNPLLVDKFLMVSDEINDVFLDSLTPEDLAFYR